MGLICPNQRGLLLITYIETSDNVLIAVRSGRVSLPALLSDWLRGMASKREPEMATLTPGRVFHLTQRFVLASRGTMVRLTAPLSRNSVGLVRPTHGSCGLLKTEQTAGLNEWPPDRREIDENASPHPQSLLQQAISAVTLTATPERQRNQLQTAPPGQSQTYRTPCNQTKRIGARPKNQQRHNNTQQDPQTHVQPRKPPNATTHRLDQKQTAT